MTWLAGANLGLGRNSRGRLIPFSFLEYPTRWALLPI